MPEMPEIQAHAERLTNQFAGRVLAGFTPFNFTALKTAVPAPSEAFGEPLLAVDRRGKYLLLRFEPVTFVVHLMQGGRLDPTRNARRNPEAARPGSSSSRSNSTTDRSTTPHCCSPNRARNGAPASGACRPTTHSRSPPLDKLGPEAADDHRRPTRRPLRGELDARARLPARPTDDRRHRPTPGERDLPPRPDLAVREHPQARRFDGAADVAAAISSCIAEGLEYERTRDDMSSSKDRPSAMHSRTGDPCPDCGDAVRAVEYSGYTVNYCPTCQTGGKVLADNTTSKFLK
jgi:formamidopyrimidine-DNA glycosylase